MGLTLVTRFASLQVMNGIRCNNKGKHSFSNIALIPKEVDVVAVEVVVVAEEVAVTIIIATMAVDTVDLAVVAVEAAVTAVVVDEAAVEVVGVAMVMIAMPVRSKVKQKTIRNWKM